MSTYYDKASLVMIPSGVKEDKLYSIKPTDGSGDFTFSRGSDIQATRVNSSGLIEKAKVNNLTYSNTFSSWGGSGTSVTSGQSGYDGSSDAWLLDITSGTGSQYRGLNVSATGVHTTSVYAKAGTLNWVLLLEVGGGSCYFDLQNGIVGTNSGTIDASIEAVGATGWYRISYAQNNTITQLRIYPATGNSNVSQSSGNILIQDAQLNHGLIAQDYVETTTTAVVEGLTADLPRLDYSGGASCPSLLLEPSRTNLITQSEYFGGSDWTGSASIVSNTAISPSGYQDAATGDNIYPSAGIGDATITNTASIFAKANPSGASTLSLGMNRYGFGDSITCTFDLSAGTKGTPVTSGTASGASADIEDYGNGWYRCSITGITSTSAGTLSFNPQNTCFIWGAQLEAGSYPTSYIPTYGAAANRGADAASKTGLSSLIGQTEGTLFAEFDFQKLITGDTGRIFCIGDNTANNRIGVGIGANGKFEGFVVSSGTLVAYMQTADVITELKNYKIALAYKANDFAFYINGTQIGTDNGGAVPTGMDKVFVGLFEIGGSGSQPSNPIKQNLLFQTRLTNAELAAITSL